jgi:ribosomal protein S12 methylthiotransferase accessory factor
MMTIIDHLNGDRSIHHVVRRPQCETCGEPLTLENAPVEIVLEVGALDAKDDGSYRRLTPQQTLDTYGHQVSRVTGVVEHLQRTNLDNDVTHVVESGVNLATVKKGAKVCGFRQNAGGKGTTPEQARAGALAEAIERYAATYAGDEPSMVYSMTKLGELAIDPRSCLLFSDNQYDTREEWNASRDGKHVIPKRFDPDIEMPWSPLWSLTEQRRVWLPTSYTYYNYVGDYPRNGCSSDSNGNAAGTSIEDAILQGFFELVERDAVSTWWYNGINRPGVDIDAYATTYDDPYFNRLRTHYSEVLDRDIWALDVTSDLGIPAFVAASKARTGLPRILLGFGAHRDPRGALLRSLTEMNQMLGMITSMEAHGAPTELDVSKPEVNWWYTPTMEQHPYVLPDPTLALTTPTDHAHDWNTDGKANVEKVVTLLADHGMTMSVANMTKPDIGMPVVKVVVPGIRHFWPRFAPGRLYEVPVKMGWRDTALTELELNPTPIFW